MSTAVDQLRDHVQQHALNLVDRALDVTVADTQAHASRRSGDLAAGVSATGPVLNDTQVQAQIISAADYSKFQDEGTGVFGPTGSRIFPKTAKALRFDWPAAGGIVFAKSVAGSPGTHFFHEPMPERWHNAIAQSAGAL
jgi:hypothetical protein